MPTHAATVTFLFTDIEGSTTRWEHHREAMSAALIRHDEILRKAIEARGGVVFKTMGDGFCAAFDNAVEALLAAIDAQAGLAGEPWGAFGREFPAVKARMGIHHGQAEARGHDYFGPALNRAARLMAAGNGGQVLLSLATQQVVREYLPVGVSLRDLGEHRLKDLRHKEHIWQAVSARFPDVTTPVSTADRARPADRIVVDETGAERSLADTLADLLAAVRSEDRDVTLTLPQVRQVLASRPLDLTEYRLGRIAEWSQPRYRLDGRFVSLTLLVDQGEDAEGERWQPHDERYDDLATMLAAVPEPAVVILGPPGSGKSTLLRHLELDLAISALRVSTPSRASSGRAAQGGHRPPGRGQGRDGADERVVGRPPGGGGGAGGDTVTFFIQLNQYKAAEAGQAAPSPQRWLATRWAAAYPDLRPLDHLLDEGRVVFLLDALNEMPAASEREFRQRVGEWKDWLVRLAREHPGNRVVFTCRTLDYSSSLSTPTLRVPQVRIEPLTNQQVLGFLDAYSPVRAQEIWAAIAGTPPLEALRAPFFLALLVDQVEAAGVLPGDRAGLFTGFVRQALRREVERDNPLFALEELLSSRDVRRIAQWQWRDAYELPERGALVPRLSALAHGIQAAAADGGSSQVRVSYDRALELVGHERDQEIVKAGLDISVLDEDPAMDEILYRHQLVQEYFAARLLAIRPHADLVRTEWRAALTEPNVDDLLDALAPADPLPSLPQTGWEETTLLAAAMTADPAAFVTDIAAVNLVLAGRIAAQPEIRPRLAPRLLDDLRGALGTRVRDPIADLRHRIACGHALGLLGDPRFELRESPRGSCLVPPVVTIPAGAYPIGDDEPLVYEGTEYRDHVPRHLVTLRSFALGQFPVTNGEWWRFMLAGGYDAEEWWRTAASQAWCRGEGTSFSDRAGKLYLRRVFLERPEILTDAHDQGVYSDEVYELWLRRLDMSDEEFDEHLRAHYPGGRLSEPQHWRDAQYNGSLQPVVGISWFEANAYCQWLQGCTGLSFRLPTEAEWEAAARGLAGRRFAYGERPDRTACNAIETHLRRPSPVGAFPNGNTPEAVADLTGNVCEWTSSAWGEENDDPDFAYPYVATDGRELEDTSPSVRRVLRGGSWADRLPWMAAVCRLSDLPDAREPYLGFRLALDLD